MSPMMLSAVHVPALTMKQLPLRLLLRQDQHENPTFNEDSDGLSLVANEEIYER